jgi:hypothetical protein
MSSVAQQDRSLPLIRVASLSLPLSAKHARESQLARKDSPNSRTWLLSVGHTFNLKRQRYA